MKSPQQVISDSMGVTLADADVLLRALERNGYRVVMGTLFPLTISAEYKVHTNGDVVVM